MSIVSHELLSSVESGANLYVVYRFTDHLGETYDVEKSVPAGWDTEADMLALIPVLELQAAENEILAAVDVATQGGNPDKVPDYQTQVEFDRRLLAALMTEGNVYALLYALPFWTATQARGGNNAVQRAAHLGVLKTEYDLVDKRFGDTQGASVFLTDGKGQVWDAVPESWK